MSWGVLEGFEKAKVRVVRLELSLLLLLILHQLLVLSLEPLNGSLEVRIDCLKLGVLRGNFRSALSRSHGVGLVKEGLLLGIAQVKVVVAALGAEDIALDEFLQISELTAALVGVALGRGCGGEIPDGRVSLDAILLAKALGVISGAVNISDDNRFGSSKLFLELLPSGLHLLAVTSPRRLELDEGILAGFDDFLVEVSLGEGKGVSREGDAEQAGEEQSGPHGSIF